jgi:hypothetical protein
MVLGSASIASEVQVIETGLNTSKVYDSVGMTSEVDVENTGVNAIEHNSLCAISSRVDDPVVTDIISEKNSLYGNECIADTVIGHSVDASHESCSEYWCCGFCSISLFLNILDQS